jgi:hypothetical protein
MNLRSVAQEVKQAMNFLDAKGKITLFWLSVLLAMTFICSLPILWTFDYFDRDAQGIFYCFALNVSLICALQYPVQKIRSWLPYYLLATSVIYLGICCGMPRKLPSNYPTSAFLWPFALVSMGIDFVLIKMFQKKFG